MESLDQMQARHRREQKDLQGRITNKKKNATKKTRKGVNDECAELERQLKERQEGELRALEGGADASGEGDTEAVMDAPSVADGISIEAKTSGTTTPAVAATATATTTQLKTGGSGTAGHESADGAADGETQQEHQQLGKKRSRQKERLARRAAEQEAAAEAAAAEASNMVDHRSAEKAHMDRELAAHSLVEREVPADGHCLFSAVADQLSSLGIPLRAAGGKLPSAGEDEDEDEGRPPYRVVRRAAARYIEGHAGDFEPFLEEPLDSYVRKIRDLAEWGGHMELLALASTYGVDIKVIADGRTAVVSPSGVQGRDVDGNRKAIWLAYYRHGFGLGEHYNSLRRKAGA